MKASNQKILSLMLASLLVFGVGCNKQTSTDEEFDIPTESVDEERTQLFVFNTDFGVDSAWLMEAKQRFEAMHASDEWEEGKRGVQVVVRSTSKTAMDVENTILTDREEVYFTQESDYRYLAEKGLLADITQVVTATPSGGESSIEGKLTQQQRSYFGVSSEDEADTPPTYYALPHEFLHFGIVYNIELFDQMGYYFGFEPQEDGNPFVENAQSKKSLGQDGLPNTADDGLPTTYAEFFTLCDYILGKKQTPITWGGSSYEVYLNWLTNALATDCDGFDQAMLQYTFDGTATGLGSIQNATFKFDSKPTQITTENGYELARSAGNYYAMEFMKKLIAPSLKYFDSAAFKKGRGQSEARKEFLWKGEDGEISDIAMLVDGCWWESDSTSFLEEAAAENGDGFAKTERRFGWMPLPKASVDKVGKQQTIVDCLGSMAFIKANVAEWKKPLAEDFLRFIYSDAELRAYTRTTGLVKPLNYALKDEDKNGLSEFSKSVLAAQSASKILYPYSTSELFLKNERFFSISEKWCASFVLAAEEQYPVEAFKNSNMTVIDYFNGLIKYRKEAWGNLK